MVLIQNFWHFVLLQDLVDLQAICPFYSKITMCCKTCVTIILLLARGTMPGLFRRHLPVAKYNVIKI